MLLKFRMRQRWLMLATRAGLSATPVPYGRDGDMKEHGANGIFFDNNKNKNLRGHD